MVERELVCSYTINAGTSNKRRGRLFYTRPCRPGVYLNPAFIRGPAFNRENAVHFLQLSARFLRKIPLQVAEKVD